MIFIDDEDSLENWICVKCCEPSENDNSTLSAHLVTQKTDVIRYSHITDEQFDSYFGAITVNYELSKEFMAIERACKDEIRISRQRKERKMVLLHLYNDVKDAAQVLIGSLANLQGVTSKEIHQRYSLL